MRDQRVWDAQGLAWEVDFDSGKVGPSYPVNQLLYESDDCTGEAWLSAQGLFPRFVFEGAGANIDLPAFVTRADDQGSEDLCPASSSLRDLDGCTPFPATCLRAVRAVELVEVPANQMPSGFEGPLHPEPL